MRFLFPSLFWFWAPFVLAPILLYLFRPRPRTVKTSTLPFFKWLAKEHQDSAWLRWLKYLVSLLLTVLVFLGATAALARLVVAPAADEMKTLVILVDRSASMAAREADGPTRLEEALAAVDARVAALPAGVGVIVIAYDARPEVLLARSVDRREVRRTLGSIDVRPVSGNADAALDLARKLAAIETPASIWHVTDEVKNESAGAAAVAADTKSPEQKNNKETTAVETEAIDKVAVENLAFPLAEPTNVGITALEVRQLPLERGTFEAFVQVHCSSEKPVATALDVLLDGREVDLRKFTLQPGGKEAMLVEIKADQTAGRTVTLRLHADGDCLDADNEVYARIPQVRPIRVLWVSRSADPYTQLALASIGDDDALDVFQGGPDAWPPDDEIDVAIFDDWLPDEWPASASIIVIDPPASLGPVRAVRLTDTALPISDLRATDEGHALLFGVATPRIDVAQTAILEADGPLQPLWIGMHGPVLLAGEAQGQRIAVFGFSPQQSAALPDQSKSLLNLASFPLLVGNAVNWAAAKQIDETRHMNRQTGTLVEPEGNKLVWIDPAKPDDALATVPLTGRAVELNRVGLWKTDSGAAGSAALLSADETLVPRRGSKRDAGGSQSQQASMFRGDLAPVLLWTILVVLLLESWLYHRCITN